jgi:deazaflavin-dependent oxidoreductase (nitroreductase family)
VEDSARKRSVAKGLAKYGANPLAKGLYRVGLPVPGTAILETIGRKSGEPRRTPVTNGLDGDVFWIVAEHGRHASYVRNIEANPRVRVRTGLGWREGTATILPYDDPRERLRKISSKRRVTALNTATVRAMQTELLTVRIDLGPSRV